MFTEFDLSRVAMNLQKLDDKSDEAQKQRWKIVFGLIGGVSVLLLIASLTYRMPLTTEQTDELIKYSESLQKLDIFCKSIPKPEDVRLVRKIISGNSRTSSISYLYQSDTEYEKIGEFYSNWFSQNGWRLEYQNTLDFSKDNFTISINKGYRKEAKYIVYCAEKL